MIRFNLLIFLTALGTIAPAQAAFRYPPQVNQEKINLVCVKRSEQLLCDVKPNQKDHLRMTIGVKPATSTVPLLINPQKQQAIANLLIWLSYILPSGLILGILLSESHNAYRSAMLKQQIDLLERLWQFSSDSDATHGRETESQ